MMWILLALAGPAFWAISNLFDEHLIKHVFSNAYGYVALTGLFGGIIALVFLLFTDVGTIDLVTLLLCGVGGAFRLFLLIPYLAATKLTNAATVAPLWNISTIIVVIVAVTFLREPLSLGSGIALLLLISSAIVATYTREAIHAGRSTLLLMTLASLFYASESLTEKLVFDRVGFTTGFFYIALSSFFVAVVIFLCSREGRQTLRQNMNVRFLALNSTNELANQLGIICSTAAISLGPISLVRAIGGLSPIYILLLTLVWTTLQPKSKMTRLTKLLVVRVILAVILAVAGLALIQTSI